MKKILAIKIILSLIFPIILFLFFATPSYSQSAGCWLTKVGNPTTEAPPLPQECLSSGSAPINESLCKPTSFPPKDRYCQMPNTPSGSTVPNGVPGLYTFSAGYHLTDWQRHGPQIWGSRELIDMLYTVSQWWKNGHTFANGVSSPPHPNGHLIIRDMASGYHRSHNWGTTVDLEATTDGSDCVANYFSHGCTKTKYNKLESVYLGWMLVDSGYLHTILHDGTTAYLPSFNYKSPITGQQTSGSVNEAINAYARWKNPGKFGNRNTIQVADYSITDNHHDHFHVYIDRKKDLNYLPGIDDFNLQICTEIAGVGCGR